MLSNERKVLLSFLSFPSLSQPHFLQLLISPLQEQLKQERKQAKVRLMMTSMCVPMTTSNFNAPQWRLHSSPEASDVENEERARRTSERPYIEVRI